MGIWDIFKKKAKAQTNIETSQEKTETSGEFPQEKEASPPQAVVPEKVTENQQTVDDGPDVYERKKAARQIDNMDDLVEAFGSETDAEVRAEIVERIIEIADAESFEAWMSTGVDISSRLKDYSNRTPLHLAVRYEKMPIVEYLIKAGFSLNATDDYKQTVLDVAAGKKDANAESMIDFLVKAGAKPGHMVLYNVVAGIPGGWDPSAEEKIDETIARLDYLKRILGPFTPDLLGRALHTAANNDQPAIVQWLLDEGADVEYIHDGCTPLWAAAQYTTPEASRAAAARVLLEAGADPNVGTGRYTPMHFASLDNDVEFIKVLKEFGGH